jgi:tRNA A37 threonylcarbamoyladenosine dehydratase
VDPLARVMRRELKKRGVKDIKVVFSTEEAIKPLEVSSVSKNTAETEINSLHVRRSTPGSVAFVPSVAGLIIASEVIRDLLH